MPNDFLKLAKPAYQNKELTRPDWTKDISRPEGPLWLNKNENLDPVLNEKIKSLAGQVKSFSFNTYPELAKVYLKLAKLDNLSPKNLLLTSGSDGAIRTIFDVFIQPGDKVLYTNPTFAMYDVYAKMFGANSLQIPYEYSESGPVLDFNKFLEIIKFEKPKLVCLPNPDSPSGTIIQDEQMKLLLDLTSQQGNLLLIDEAYFPFYPRTVIHLINEYKNLFVCRSFSKAWGAAGLRVGYLASNIEMMELLHKNRAMYELPTLSSEILNLLLDCKKDVLDSVEQTEQGRKYFINAMTELGYVTTKSYGNFIHVNFKQDEAKIAEALKDIVLYRVDFNSASCMRGFARFSLAPEEQMKIIVEKIKSVKK
jgi:histidinol-phosphate aminotransferase